MADLYMDKLNWKAFGYSARPTAETDAELRKDPEFGLWIRMQEVLEEAKKGNFSNVGELIDLHNQGKNAVLKSRCARILGDAGSSACFDRVREELLFEFNRGDEYDIDKLSNFSEALWSWGELSIVPVLIQQFRFLGASPDSEIIPIRLSFLLEKEQWGDIADVPKADSLEEYCALVVESYELLKAKLGTDKVIVYNGDLWSVNRFAGLILRRVGDVGFSHTFNTVLRRKFEASTGIDCTDFFEAGGFRPLAAAAIVEEFLDSGESDNYQDGVRYFFGHQIPD